MIMILGASFLEALVAAVVFSRRSGAFAPGGQTAPTEIQSDQVAHDRALLPSLSSVYS